MRTAIEPRPIENPIQRFIYLTIATAFGSGYAPLAPGTVGSLVGIPLGLLLIYIPGWQAILILSVFFALVLPIVKRCCEHWGEMDSGRIVVDEVLGQALALLSLRYFVRIEGVFPPTIFIFFSFILFRVFDIVKPFPARTFDRQATAFGVLADDVVCGLYAALITHALIRIWPWF